MSRFFEHSCFVAWNLYDLLIIGSAAGICGGCLFALGVDYVLRRWDRNVQEHAIVIPPTAIVRISPRERSHYAD